MRKFGLTFLQCGWMLFVPIIMTACSMAKNQNSPPMCMVNKHIEVNFYYESHAVFDQLLNEWAKC